MKRLLPFFFLPLLLLGCASQQDLQALRWEVDSIKTRLVKAEAKVKEKDRLVEQGLGQQAELQARLNELREQMFSLQGSIEEIRNASGAGMAGKAGEERLSAIEKEMEDLRALFLVQAQPRKSLFETGVEKYRAGKLPEALSDFSSFLSSNPEPALAAETHFWIGETLYAQGKYEDAVLKYDLVAKKYAKSQKVPDCLLKQGMAFHKMGDSETGNIILKKLIQGYSSTEAAAKANKIVKDGL
ncbi:MAG: tol-pal system protein YbgF [Desulfomonilia bacterium]|jgi:tol-pal system protein YbgF|nr:tol-pal system protein YbgF [Deltaproteobacteria bacterium]MDX9762238.1 tol-pal system protein YbgF [Desulfomonilia bacterium]HPX51477.1 tol-pal system protein YbgF [Deltaproteobacteria bacterium]HQA72864.1 tol-pal system protein YbgF [Deltaproteobacteria bacterium]